MARTKPRARAVRTPHASHKASSPQLVRTLRPSTTAQSKKQSQQPESPSPGSKKRRRVRSDPWLPRRKPRARKPRAPPATHFTCRICAEELPKDNFLAYLSAHMYPRYHAEIPLACVRHLCRPPRSKTDPVCRTCIGRNMVARHDLVGARKVSYGCVEPDCDAFWAFDFVMNFFPDGEPLERYNMDMLNVWKEESTLVTCINEACGTQGLPDPHAPGYPQVQCVSPTCRLRFCATCLVPWHNGQTCHEIAAARVEASMTDPERSTLAMMQKRDAKRCPNCFLVIEKDGGCSSMYCEGCRKYFDWSTAASAVVGKNKALPVPPPGHFGLPNVLAVCEMDGLEKGKVMAVASKICVPS